MKSGKQRAGRSWPAWKALCLLSCVGAGLIGCVSARRVVLIDSEGALLRVGPGVKARVYFLNKAGEWELGANPVPIPEGWVIGPFPASAPKK